MNNNECVNIQLNVYKSTGHYVPVKLVVCSARERLSSSWFDHFVLKTYQNDVVQHYIQSMHNLRDACMVHYSFISSANA